MEKKPPYDRCGGHYYYSVCRKHSYISTMPSGRLPGISVRPFRRQSTMLLLQVQLGGHTATWGTHVLGSVCAWPAESSIIQYVWLSSMATRLFSTFLLKIYGSIWRRLRGETKMREAGLLLRRGARVACTGGCKQKKARLKAYRESRAWQSITIESWIRRL